MRSARLFRFSLYALALTLSTSSIAQAQADFDPRGRKKPAHPAPTRRAPPRPGPARPDAKPTAAPTSPDGASGAALIDRYTKIVLAQPGSPFPLQRLAQLYRDRDGDITKLAADFEKRAAQPGAEQYAAAVTLAGIYKIDGRAEEAVKTYEKAVALKADDPTALLALARALQDRGDVAAARTRYEQALALQSVAADREQTLRTLMGLALDGKDLDGAKKFHAQLVKQQATSLFVRGELGRELYARGEYERAEAEFKDLVAAAAGDNRALAPALKDLGRAQAKAHKNQEAIATLRKGLAAAGQEAAVRAEIYETITEIYRADQNLPALVRELEAAHPTDFARLALLASLYEETGDAANALATYRRALATNPRHIDLRLKLIRLLQSQGELDKAIAEYEGLIRAAPNNPQFVFEQCETLMQRGERARALKLLTELEARATGEEEVLARLAEFYGRIGESERSMRVLQRLTQVASNDPGHLVDLGDRYFQDGNTPLAVQTWKRILTTIQPRARALAALGEVYLEHDMTADALASLREAVQLEPATLAYKKQLAGALERSRSYREARTLWQELAERGKADADKLLAREARTHIVTLWGLEHVLPQQVTPLQIKFDATPPDVEAGRLLAEVFIHLRRLPDAEGVLRKVVRLAPGDADAYLSLERVLVQENKLADAIAVLEKLVQVEPKRARELYQRMAQYALQTYKDEDAIKYAARAVELNPDDAEGHRRLGEMYRSRQDAPRAIREFRQAIAKNERLYIVYFELADLLLSSGEADEADRLFRRVVRGAPDEELVARAARLSMQINLGRGTLESLEQDLLPLAIGNPQRTIYRRLLVEIYGNLTFGLMQKVLRGSGKEAEAARASLARIGARAVKPLLDALAAGDPAQQRVAIDVLGYVENRNAGAPLFAFAMSQADTQLRTRAMIACGALRDPGLLPRYEAFLAPRAGAAGDGSALPTDAIAVAATWGLARMGEKRALPLLRAVMKWGTPEMRAFAVLGLGLSKDRGSVPEVAAVARSFDAGNVARAAAAYALGELGAESETATLLTLAEGTDALPRQTSLMALARMGAARGEQPSARAAVAAMADALFAGEGGESVRARAVSEALARSGAAALTVLTARGETGRAREALPVPDGPLDVEAALAQLVPRDLPAKDRAAALLKHEGAIERAAVAALQTSGERARSVLDALAAGDGSLEPLVDARESADLAPAQARVREMAKRLEPRIITLVRHPDAAIRTKAIAVLARSPTDAAAEAVVSAADDPNENVARVALAALGGAPAAEAGRGAARARSIAAVARVLDKSENWAMRVLAAEAMGRLGGSGATTEATRHLTEAAVRDPYALVREAALKALASYDMAHARELAQRMTTTDPEPRVRDTARAIAAAR